MKKECKLIGIIALTVIIVCTFAGCGDKSSGDPSSPPTTKTVSVGSQSGTLVAGAAGSVTFPVTTTNIANGTYTATVDNRPTGVTVSGSVIINAGSGTLTLAGNSSTLAGVTNTMTLTIVGTKSAAFTLTISPTTSISVSAQSGPLFAGNPATTTTFNVTTNNIANGTYTISLNNRPAGISLDLSSIVITSGQGTFRVNGGSGTVAGTYNNPTLTITFSGTGVTSAAFPLVISSAYVTVGAQSRSFQAGYPGSYADFNVTTNLADGTYTISLNNRPSGVTLDIPSITVSGGQGTFRLNGGSGTQVGTYNTLTLTFTVTGGDVTSAQFTLNITS